MSMEYDRAAARPPVVNLPATEQRIPDVTLEQAEEARRHAAEIGDYVTAQRWLWHERTLATQEDRAARP